MSVELKHVRKKEPYKCLFTSHSVAREAAQREQQADTWKDRACYAVQSKAAIELRSPLNNDSSFHSNLPQNAFSISQDGRRTPVQRRDKSYKIPTYFK